MRAVPMMIFVFLLSDILILGCHSQATKPGPQNTQDLIPSKENGLAVTIEDAAEADLKPDTENSSDDKKTTILKFQNAQEIRSRMTRPIFPRYPRMARLAKAQGKVTARLYFDEKGDLDQYKIMTDQPVFIDSVKQAILRFKLQPHLVNGRPVKTFTVINFVFRIGSCVSCCRKKNSVNRSVQLTQRPLTEGEWDSPPKLVKRIQPLYPREAAKNKIEGFVKLRIVIDSKGFVVNPGLLEEEPKGFGLFKASLKAIEQWRYKPAIKNGKPVPSIAEVKMTFHVGE